MATPQPIALTGVYTIAAGPANLETLLPAASYPRHIAWAIDRTPDAGYMVSTGAVWTSNAGAAGTDGNTILSGIGSPSGALGKNGDFYVDLPASRMYGPRTAGVWGSGFSLVGPQPSLSNATPIVVGAASSGLATDASRSDHSHATDTQRAKVTTATDGTYTWTFPSAFGAGVVPVIEGLAVGAGTDVINVQLTAAPTNTAAAFRVTRTQISVVALLGLSILSVPASAGATVLHVTARAP